MTRNLLRTMAASASVLPGAAMALGLGPIDVKSVLDQPLDARIPIVSVRPGELDGLTANLASRELFRRMGLERPSLLGQLNFAVEGLDSGTPYIRVTSRAPMREPSLNILLEVSWSTGRMLRDFSVLLDPPVSVRSAPKQSVVAAAPTSRSRVSTAPRSRTQSSSAFSGGSYGPVAPGETLWTIADNMRPDRSVSIPQMMLALLRTNPGAFYQPNVNSLNAGAVLRMPSGEELNQLSRSAAKGEVDRQHAAIGASWATRSGVPGNVRTSGRQTSDAATAGVPPTEDSAGNAATGLGQIRLVEADEAGAGSPSSAMESGAGMEAGTAGASGPLIQVESGGVALQLVGLEGLGSRMPTVVGVHDAALATGFVGESLDERVSADEEPSQDDATAGLDAESEILESLGSDVAELAGETEGLAADGIGESIEAASDAAASAEAFRAEVSIPAAADFAQELGQASPAPGESSALDLPAEAPESDARGAEIAAVSDGDLLDFNSATVAPLTAETFDALPGEESLEADEQLVAADVEMDVESMSESVVIPESFEMAEPSATGEGDGVDAYFDEEGVYLDEEGGYFGEEGAEAPWGESGSESYSTPLAGNTRMLPSTQTIATYGGGVLAVLLLLLALVRRALGGNSPAPKLEAQDDKDSGAGVEGTEAAEPVSGFGAADAAAESDAAGDEATGEDEQVDPAAKADVLIAMGEHAQAVELLSAALERTPDNAHVAFKVLEAHAAADDGESFASFAGAHRELLQGSGLWPEVLLVGNDLCPEHELFGGGEEAEDEDVEVTETAEAAPFATQELPAISTMLEDADSADAAPAGAEQEDVDGSADILEFKLPEEEKAEAVAELGGADAEAEIDPGLEFDLEEFSLDAAATGTGQVRDAGPLEEDMPLTLDGVADLGDDEIDATLKLESVAELGGEDEIDSTLKLDAIPELDSLELELPGQDTADAGLELEASANSESAAAADGDAKEGDSFVDTKLDLATAYLEMGDNDGARALYEEVVEEGNDMQRQMAEEALSKMG